MKNKRNSSLKIPDIKSVRSLTRFLGKLHLPSCYCIVQETVPMYDNSTYIGLTEVQKEAYGFGLKESKDFVEGWFDYEDERQKSPVPQSPWMPYPRN